MKSVNFSVLRKMITTVHSVGRIDVIVKKLLSAMYDNNSSILLELNEICSDLGVTLAIFKCCLRRKKKKELSRQILFFLLC